MQPPGLTLCCSFWATGRAQPRGHWWPPVLPQSAAPVQLSYEGFSSSRGCSYPAPAVWTALPWAVLAKAAASVLSCPATKDCTQWGVPPASPRTLPWWTWPRVSLSNPQLLFVSQGNLPPSQKKWNEKLQGCIFLKCLCRKEGRVLHDLLSR